MVKDCCKSNNEIKCVRSSDMKVFSLPRKFKKKDCLNRTVKGFTMKSSCAPFKDCNKNIKRMKSRHRRTKRRNKSRTRKSRR